MTIIKTRNWRNCLLGCWWQSWTHVNWAFFVALPTWFLSPLHCVEYFKLIVYYAAFFDKLYLLARLSVSAFTESLIPFFLCLALDFLSEFLVSMQVPLKAQRNVLQSVDCEWSSEGNMQSTEVDPEGAKSANGLLFILCLPPRKFKLINSWHSILPRYI